jgi:co-chaperonin GroES (HSP10)
VSNKILPTGDNVLLELVDQTKTAGGLIIPEKARGNQRDAIIGKVLAVGTGRTSDYGARMVPESKVGDYVLLARGAGVEVELAADRTAGEAGKKLRIIRDCELLGRVEESRIIALGLVTS